MNPKILPVLDEISAVLKKHDMAGVFVIGNATHCDWRMDVDASWSCAHWEDKETGKLRIRAKREDFPTPEAQKECLESTVGTFVTFQDALARVNENLNKLLLLISRRIPFIGKSTEEP